MDSGVSLGVPGVPGVPPPPQPRLTLQRQRTVGLAERTFGDEASEEEEAAENDDAGALGASGAWAPRREAVFGDTWNLAPLPQPFCEPPVSDEEPEPDAVTHGPVRFLLRIERREACVAPRVPGMPGARRAGLLTLAADATPSDAERAAQEEDTAPVTLVCVADVSASMEGEKLLHLRAALAFVAESLQDADTFALVAFNDAAHCLLAPAPMNAVGRAAAIAAIGTLTASGGTSIASGLDEGAAQLLRAPVRLRRGLSALVLLTDGQDDSGALCGRRGGEAGALWLKLRKAGATLYALGLGEDHDAGLLRQLAERSRTPFLYIARPSDLPSAFGAVRRSLGSAIARRVTVRLATAASPPCLPRVVTPFEVRTLDGGAALDVLVPDLLLGERRDVLLEWPAGVDDAAPCGPTSALQATLSYVDVRRGVAVAGVTPQTGYDDDGDEAEPEPDAELFADIAVQRCRLEAAAALLDAAAQTKEVGRVGGFAGSTRSALASERARAGQLLLQLRREHSAPCEQLVAELEQAAARLEQEGGAAAALQAIAHATALQRLVTL